MQLWLDVQPTIPSSCKIGWTLKAFYCFVFFVVVLFFLFFFLLIRITSKKIPTRNVHLQNTMPQTMALSLPNCKLEKRHNSHENKSLFVVFFFQDITRYSTPQSQYTCQRWKPEHKYFLKDLVSKVKCDEQYILTDKQSKSPSLSSIHSTF